MSGPTRVANPARPVRCSAGCATLVWLAGALPTTADDAVLCSVCTAAAKMSEGVHLSDRPGEASGSDAVDAPRAAPCPEPWDDIHIVAGVDHACPDGGVA
jgi:hypothetical protein